MSLLRLAVVMALAGAGACDIRPLTSTELYGAAGAGGLAGAAGTGALTGTAGAGGSPGAAGSGGLPGTAGASGSAGSAGSGGMTTDAAVDQSTPDAPPADGGPDAPPSGCAQRCSAEQFCDELTNRCAPRVGTGMLSGTVSDPCATDGLDALVGIGGQHRCSYTNKGSYFFTNLPLGRLKLAAAKEGYELYGATVEIVPGGVIHDIKLVRTGGCTAPRPTVACTCTDSSCNPTTP